MSTAATASRALYVVSTSQVAARSASQRYFAALLPLRRAVGGELCVALRRLHTIAGDAHFDHLRVSRFPGPDALQALRRAPLPTLLRRARTRGVTELCASQATPLNAPRPWHELRAAWALLEQDIPHEGHRADDTTRTGTPAELQQVLTHHPETHGITSFFASLTPLPDLGGRHPSPAPLPAARLTLVGFPSVRIALDTLALPAVASAVDQFEQRARRFGGGSWSLVERVSLREMLTLT